MRYLTILTAPLLMTASSAFAQTPAPVEGAPASPSGADPAVTGGGVADYWWIILLVIIAIAAIWYFSRSRRNTRV